MKLSIITASYNNSKYLAEYYQSLMNQTYKNIEIIFVNDASEDDTAKIVSSWSNVKLISTDKRIFCSSAYAMALREATGDICGIVDSDDIIVPTAAERIVATYENNPNIDYIYTQHNWCDENMRIYKKGVSRFPTRGRSLLEMATCGRGCYSHWRTFKTELRNKCTIFPEGLKYAVDQNMGFVLEETARGGFTPATLYYYRVHRTGITSIHGSEQKNQSQKLCQEFTKRRQTKGVRPIPIVNLG